jgi:lipoprotein-anchoring transpeptidase ErfK/SrfK
VKRKERHPVWYPPSWHWSERGREVPERRYAIRGVLGKYRLNLGHSYGIHGTRSGRIRPGKYSHGCIRMNRKDLQIVYKLTDVGTEVYIY